MLLEKDGTPKAIRTLIVERLLPLLEKAGAGQFHLTAGRQGNANGHNAHGGAEHSHFYPEICFCLAGRAQIWTDTEIRDLVEGDVLVIAPFVRHCAGSLHAINIPEKTVYSRLLWMAAFPYGCIFNLCESCGGEHRTTSRQLLVENHANASIQDMFLELKTGAAFSHLIAKWKLLEALARLHRAEDAQWADPSAAGAPLAEAEHRRESTMAGRARAFVEEHFDSDLDLDSVAQAVCTNKSHLCRVFKVETGITVIEYLTKVRVDASRRLLLTSLPISAISKLVGFNDPYYFSRVFHKATGLSPSDYRDQYQPDLAPTEH